MTSLQDDFSRVFYDAPRKYSGPYSVQNRVEALCKIMGKIVDNKDYRTFQTILHTLVTRVFGFDNEVSWLQGACENARSAAASTPSAYLTSSQTAASKADLTSLMTFLSPRKQTGGERSLSPSRSSRRSSDRSIKSIFDVLSAFEGDDRLYYVYDVNRVPDILNLIRGLQGAALADVIRGNRFLSSLALKQTSSEKILLNCTEYYLASFVYYFVYLSTTSSYRYTSETHTTTLKDLLRSLLEAFCGNSASSSKMGRFFTSIMCEMWLQSSQPFSPKNELQEAMFSVLEHIADLRRPWFPEAVHMSSYQLFLQAPTKTQFSSDHKKIVVHDVRSSVVCRFLRRFLEEMSRYYMSVSIIRILSDCWDQLRFYVYLQLLHTPCTNAPAQKTERVRQSIGSPSLSTLFQGYSSNQPEHSETGMHSQAAIALYQAYAVTGLEVLQQVMSNMARHDLTEVRMLTAFKKLLVSFGIVEMAAHTQLFTFLSREAESGRDMLWACHGRNLDWFSSESWDVTTKYGDLCRAVNGEIDDTEYVREIVSDWVGFTMWKIQAVSGHLHAVRVQELHKLEQEQFVSSRRKSLLQSQEGSGGSRSMVRFAGESGSVPTTPVLGSRQAVQKRESQLFEAIRSALVNPTIRGSAMHGFPGDGSTTPTSGLTTPVKNSSAYMDAFGLPSRTPRTKSRLMLSSAARGTAASADDELFAKMDTVAGVVIFQCSSLNTEQRMELQQVARNLIGQLDALLARHETAMQSKASRSGGRRAAGNGSGGDSSVLNTMGSVIGGMWNSLESALTPDPVSRTALHTTSSSRSGTLSPNAKKNLLSSDQRNNLIDMQNILRGLLMDEETRRQRDSDRSIVVMPPWASPLRRDKLSRSVRRSRTTTPASSYAPATPGSAPTVQFSSSTARMRVQSKDQFGTVWSTENAFLVRLMDRMFFALEARGLFESVDRKLWRVHDTLPRFVQRRLKTPSTDSASESSARGPFMDRTTLRLGFRLMASYSFWFWCVVFFLLMWVVVLVRSP